MVKDKKISNKDTYLGIEKIEGKDYWKIKQTSEAVADADGNKVSYEATVWVDPTNGMVFKTEGTYKDLPTPSGPITSQISSKALKAGDKDKAVPAKPEKKDN